MNNIKDYILNIYNGLQENEVLPISNDSIKDAIRHIEVFSLKDSKNLFVIVAALNLLSADAKKNVKTNLYYSYIKSNVSKVADYVISNKNIFPDASVYYDKNQRCFYFNVFEVIFSFHQVKETEKILEAANYDPIIWPGIRLQRIAQTIFDYAVTMSSDNAEIVEKSDSSITELMNQDPLFSCPDCGKQISKSAKFCPHCGFDNSGDEEIVKDVNVGNRVQIDSNGTIKVGTVQTKGKNYLGLKLQDGTIYRVRYNYISSISLITQPVIENSSVYESTAVSNRCYELLRRIIMLEEIDWSSNILTNSVLKEISPMRIRAITDGGKSIYCRFPVGFSWKSSKVGTGTFMLYRD